MTAAENEAKQGVALNLLTNRILMDFISLQVDAGRMSVEEAKQLVRFSAREVVRGTSGLDEEIERLSEVLTRRFDDTDYSDRAE